MRRASYEKEPFKALEQPLFPVQDISFVALVALWMLFIALVLLFVALVLILVLILVLVLISHDKIPYI